MGVLCSVDSPRGPRAGVVGAAGAEGRAPRQVDGATGVSVHHPACPGGAGAGRGGGAACAGWRGAALAWRGAALGEDPVHDDPLQLPGPPGGASWTESRVHIIYKRGALAVHIRMTVFSNVFGHSI